MVYSRCLLVNPHVQAVQKMCGKGGYMVFKADLRAAKCLPIIQNKEKHICGVKKKYISQNLRYWALKRKSLLPLYFGKKWFMFESSISKIVGDFLFATAHIFANGPHLVALTFFPEFLVPKDSVGTCPEKISHWKFSDTEQCIKKFRFSLISLSIPPKKVSARVPTDWPSQ